MQLALNSASAGSLLPPLNVPPNIMHRLVLSSTLLLTLLLMIGLFFFVKASVKERLQQAKLLSEQPEEPLLNQLQQYFSDRAYRLTTVDPEQEQIIFEGLVRPSAFLATFLTLIVSTSLLCLGLVLATLVPQVWRGFLGLTLLSPLAAVFYWRKAKRPEQVCLRVESLGPTLDNSSNSSKAQTLLTVTAHRDEIIELQRDLKLRKVD